MGRFVPAKNRKTKRIIYISFFGIRIFKLETYTCAVDLAGGSFWVLGSHCFGGVGWRPYQPRLTAVYRAWRCWEKAVDLRLALSRASSGVDLPVAVAFDVSGPTFVKAAQFYIS